MANVKVTYGGRKGRSFTFAVSNDYLVVRTRDRRSLAEAAISSKGRESLTGMSRVLAYPQAGVEVLHCPGRGKKVIATRDRARRALKKETGIQFAGRVLVMDKDKSPVVYTENLFVKFSDDTGKSACRRILKEFGLAVKRTLEYARNAFFVSAAEGTGMKVFAMASKLLRDSHVELCHPELIHRLDYRGAFPQQWHLKKATIDGNVIDQHASVEAAWPISEGQDITIAVIDDGTDMTHGEFAGSWKIVSPRDVTRGTNDPTPGNGDNHGTACAGVACANGSHGAAGVAPKAKLMPIRLASGLGSQAEADAFYWAAQNGADVISCSWGPRDGEWWNSADPTHSQNVPLPDSTRLAIDYATTQGRNGKGCVITWAAGNGNESADLDGYASYGPVIAVAACNDQGQKSAYSDYGDAVWCCFPSNHGYASVTPGIWTTDRMGVLGYNSGGDTDSGDTEGNYTNGFGGTSSACPGAAGAAALILSRNPALRWDEVKDIIKRSCDKIDTQGGQYDSNGHSAKYGYGRVNAERAVTLALPPQPKYRAIHTAVQDVPIKDRKTSSLSIELGETKPIKGIAITVDIEHTYVGDLVVQIVPPSGTGVSAVTLHDRSGGGSDNLKLTYDPAGTPGLGQLIGVNPQGKWRLKVSDNAYRDEGLIKQFGVDIVL